MRLLLDTHIYIWAVADDPKLKASARTLIQDADEIYISSASIWEAAIKAGLGKLDADVTLLVDGIRSQWLPGIACQSFPCRDGSKSPQHPP